MALELTTTNEYNAVYKWTISHVCSWLLFPCLSVRPQMAFLGLSSFSGPWSVKSIKITLKLKLR